MESDKFSIVNSCDIEKYEYLGKDWAESEVIYNVSKLNLFNNYEYLGIIHWDFNLYSKDYDTYRITENIGRILDRNDLISFFPGMYLHISGIYDVMMDDRKPNCLFCRDSNLENPKSCNEYLKQFLPNSDIDLDTINDRTIIPLCCSFLCKREKFVEIGNIIGKIMESGVLDRFDVEKRHRYPGQVIERLVGLYLSGMFNNPFCFRLDHRFTGGMELKKNDLNGENY